MTSSGTREWWVNKRGGAQRRGSTGAGMAAPPKKGFLGRLRDEASGRQLPPPPRLQNRKFLLVASLRPLPALKWDLPCFLGDGQGRSGQQKEEHPDGKRLGEASGRRVPRTSGEDTSTHPAKVRFHGKGTGKGGGGEAQMTLDARCSPTPALTWLTSHQNRPPTSASPPTVALAASSAWTSLPAP